MEGALANGSDLISPVSRVGLRLASDERLVSLVRRGGRAGATAFEALYERHVRGLLSFCIYMLGSRDDAEDAVQAAFAAAHRSLLSNGREVTVRPWLFAIARNECIDILRKRRPTVELNGEPATTGDPVRTLQLREEVRGLFEDVRRLPERQRTALVLAEVDGLSQAQIGGILGVRSEQVKAYVYQARTNLISDRGAREADCAEIREQLATSRGPALRRTRIRRHTRSCAGCRAYAESVRRQQRELTALVPVMPTLALKYRVLEQLVGFGSTGSYAEGAAIGSALTGAVAELAGGGMKALAAKLAAGVLAVGATAEVGMSVLGTMHSSHASHDVTAQSAGTTTGSLASRPLAVASVTPEGGSAAARHAGGNGALTSVRPLRGESRGSGGEASSPGESPSAGPPAVSPEGQPSAPAGSVPSHPPSAGTPQAPSGESWGTGSTGHSQSGAHTQAHRERELARAGREKLREERKASRGQGAEKPAGEEPPEVGMSGAPKLTPQEREEKHEEHERKREQRKKEREERLASK